jgi:flagellar biosynthetic protein FliQ
MELLREAVLLTLWLAAPPLLAALLAGFLAGFFQGATQIQDASISAVSKLSALAVVLLWSAPRLFDSLSWFAARVWGGS